MPASDDTAPVKRQSLSKRLRYEILRRDGHTCRYCGATAPDVRLVVDHIIPVTLGGSDDPTNLVTACVDCNSGKGSTSPADAIVSDVADLAHEMATALEAVAKQRRLAGKVTDAVLDDFYDRWVALYSYGKYSNLPQGWESSIGTFLKRGLDAEDLRRFSLVPERKGVANQMAFRYFCGCCWNEIKNREEIAHATVLAAREQANQVTPSAIREMVADPACTACDGYGIAPDGTGARCYCVRPLAEESWR